MDYFKVLNFDREPFSNSPDPDFFFDSREHLGCLQKIELSLRMRRGLNVVIGDVGTGKTTLSRQLIRKFANDEQVETHLILDPEFSSPSEFLSTVTGMFWKQKPKAGTSQWQMKEIIKKYIFHRGVNEKKTVILIIDEGQKLRDFCLEILREFLNYETNEHKLLQIVIFAQREFEQALKNHMNFTDRINLYHVLGPLDFSQTRAMIHFRLKQATNGNRRPSLFSYPALWSIYRSTGGYPRRIVNLCHTIILTLIVQNRSKAGWSAAQSCAKRVFPERAERGQKIRLYALSAVLAAVILSWLWVEHGAVPMPWKGLGEKKESPSVVKMTLIQVPRPQQPAGPEVYEKKPPPKTAEASSTVAREEKEAFETVQEASKPVSAASSLASSEGTGQHREPPPLLGQLILGKQETLGSMIHKVYGIYNDQRLKRVTEVNREMTNPDRLPPGQLIRFPAVPVTVTQPPADCWWVESARKGSLEEAYQFMKSYQGDSAGIRMIPCWNEREGLKFVLIHKKTYFKDQDSAKAYVEGLPPKFSAGVRIMNDWGSDTVFFADPFL